MSRIYLDAGNGSPLSHSVRAAMAQVLTQWGNPSSGHTEGRAAAFVLETARRKVASLIGATPEEILFTSSGTEANTWALTGLGQRGSSGKRHLVVSAVEHLSILQTARRMEKEGCLVTAVAVEGTGRIPPAALEEALTPQTALVSIQWANAEVGTVQPMEEIARRVKERGILLHTDAVAAAGQIPLDVRQVPVDALSLASNTFGGPPGVGALFVRKGVRIAPLLVGGAQEGGRRAGTENVMGIAGMGAAAHAASQQGSAAAERLIPLRDRLIHGILDQFPAARLTGDRVHRLPGHVSVCFPGIDAETLVCALDVAGIAAGIGSACTARTRKASHVLKAMGVPDSQALGAVSFTLHAETTEDHVEGVLQVLPRVLAAREPALIS